MKNNDNSRDAQAEAAYIIYGSKNSVIGKAVDDQNQRWESANQMLSSDDYSEKHENPGGAETTWYEYGELG